MTTEFKALPFTKSARYEGKCFLCEQKIRKGEELTACSIPNLTRNKWAHTECVVKNWKKDDPGRVDGDYKGGDAEHKGKADGDAKGSGKGDSKSGKPEQGKADGKPDLEKALEALKAKVDGKVDSDLTDEQKAKLKKALEKREANKAKFEPVPVKPGDVPVPEELKPTPEMAAAMQALMQAMAAQREAQTGIEDAVARQMAAEAKQQVEELEKKRPRPQRIKLQKPEGDKKDLEGHFHPIFKQVLELAAAKCNIYIPGPTGCGKTHLARQVAEALDKPFYFISCSAGMSEGQLTGRLLPTGDSGKFEYARSEFVKAYEEGGVFLLDEIDAADANVLLVINAALANGHLPLPNRLDNPVAKRHEDFVLIAAANTWGVGADRRYVGRNQLDAATLDRFLIGQVPMDYDEGLERSLISDVELYEKLKGYRQRINDARLERNVSTRFVLDADKMVANGWTHKRVEEALFSGWTPDEKRKVKK